MDSILILKIGTEGILKKYLIMAPRKPPVDRPGTPLENRNFLSPVGFKFSLKRAPGVAFFCNQANIPSIRSWYCRATNIS